MRQPRPRPPKKTSRDSQVRTWMKSPRDYALKPLEKELPVLADVCLGIPIPGSTSQPDSAFWVAPSTPPSGHDRLLNRGARLSWAEAMDKELAECVWLHEEEATLQFPLSLPPTRVTADIAACAFQSLVFWTPQWRGVRALAIGRQGDLPEWDNPPHSAGWIPPLVLPRLWSMDDEGQRWWWRSPWSFGQFWVVLDRICCIDSGW